MRVLTFVSLAWALTGVAPTPVFANPFAYPLFSYSADYNYGRLYAHEHAGEMLEAYKEYSPEDTSVSSLDGYPIVGGSMQMTSGEFLSRTDQVIGGRVDTHDAFASSGYLLANWIIELPDATTREINFRARLGQFDLFYDTPASAADVLVLPFYSGFLDPDDAAFLGVPAAWLKGEVDIYLDELREGDLDDPGFALYGVIDAYSVPEPVTIALLPIGLVALRLRRRR